MINLCGDQVLPSSKSTPHAMFINYINRLANQLRQNGRQRTSETYRCAAQSFSKFLGGDIAIPYVSADLIMRYEQHMHSQSLCHNTSSFYMRRLRAAYNRAVDEGLTQDNRPFRRVYTGVARTIKRAITIDDMHRIRQLEINEPQLELARNYFLFSFYTSGMSFVDMAYLEKKNLSNGLLSYRRVKTGQQISIRWNDSIRHLVERIGQGRGRYLLPIIKKENGKERNQMRHVQYKVNQDLKTIGHMAGLQSDLTMYVARHTWASIALSLQVPVSIISQGMGHDSEKTTRIYLKQFDRSLLDRACDEIINAV